MCSMWRLPRTKATVLERVVSCRLIPISAAAFLTRSWSSWLTRAEPFRMRETVATLTFARVASSWTLNFPAMVLVLSSGFVCRRDGQRLCAPDYRYGIIWMKVPENLSICMFFRKRAGVCRNTTSGAAMSLQIHSAQIQGLLASGSLRQSNLELAFPEILRKFALTITGKAGKQAA